MATTEDIVRRYFAVVADLASTPGDLHSLVHPDASFREMPNPITPRGALRDVAETTRGFLAGKSRLSGQSIEVEEILTVGEDRAVVRSTWRGRIGDTEITAHMAGFLRLRDGRIVEHVTYDCYEPFSFAAPDEAGVQAEPRP
jgi:ketosteroid isomerase-like protein